MAKQLMTSNEFSLEQQYPNLKDLDQKPKVTQDLPLASKEELLKEQVSVVQKKQTQPKQQELATQDQPTESAGWKAAITQVPTKQQQDSMSPIT